LLGASTQANLPDIISTLMHSMPFARLPQTAKSSKLREQAAEYIAQAVDLEHAALQQGRCDRAQLVILARYDAGNERLQELTAASKERKHGLRELAKLQDRAAEYQARADAAKTGWSAGLHRDADASALDVLQNSIVVASTQLHAVHLEIEAVSDRLSEVDAIIDGDDADDVRAEVEELSRITADPAASMQVITDEAAEYRKGLGRYGPKQAEAEDAIMKREVGAWGSSAAGEGD
jgi:hypothetical protein